MRTVKQFLDLVETASGDSGLGDWIRKSSGTDPKTGRKVPGWVQLGGPFAGAPCARQPGQKSTPKCGSSRMAANLSDEEEERAFRRKNRKDPNQPEKTGAAKPTYVKTEEMNLQEKKKESKKDACYHKVKSRYDVWPSAYGSLALSKCRKVGASNWGNKSEEVDLFDVVYDFLISENLTEQEVLDIMARVPIDEILNLIEEYKDLTPEKEERVKNRVGELARDIQVSGERMKELRAKPFAKHRRGIQKQAAEIIKNAKKKQNLVQNASDALIRTSTSRSAKIQKRIEDLKNS